MSEQSSTRTEWDSRRETDDPSDLDSIAPIHYLASDERREYRARTRSDESNETISARRCASPRDLVLSLSVRGREKGEIDKPHPFSCPDCNVRLARLETHKRFRQRVGLIGQRPRRERRACTFSIEIRYSRISIVSMRTRGKLTFRKDGQ
jgi:hypothetical protein